MDFVPPISSTCLDGVWDCAKFHRPLPSGNQAHPVSNPKKSRTPGFWQKAMVIDMTHHPLTPILSGALLAAFSISASAQTPFTPFPSHNSLTSESWTWDKTRADQQIIGGTPQAVTYSHIGNLATGLRGDSGSSAAALRLISGPARIDNGLPELIPEPYRTVTGTTYAYPVPSSYTGVFGLYAGDASAYAAMMFPNSMAVYNGTYTQAMVDQYHANGGWTGYWDGLDSQTQQTYSFANGIEDMMAASRFSIDVNAVDPAATSILFQIRIQGLGPTVADVENGTYITTFGAAYQLGGINFVYNGTESLEFTSAELVSYTATSAGSRHSYVHAGYEEIWEFSWDISNIAGGVDQFSIEFGNYPTSVISGLAVAQIPEPSTWVLLGAGAAFGLVLARRRRQTSL